MPAPIPMHAVRKQAALGLDLLRELEPAVAAGRPLDQELARHYRRHREFGSRDRRFFSALAFAWFRWRGWLSAPGRPDACDAVLAWLLDASESHPAIEELAGRLPGPAAGLRPPGPLALDAKAAFAGQWHQRPPPEAEALVPAWLGDVLFCPEGAEPAVHRRRCLESFQVRPPAWLRVRPGNEQDILARLNKALLAPKQDKVFPPGRAATPAELPADPAMEPAGNPSAGGRALPSDKCPPGQTSGATIHPRLPQAVRLPQGVNPEILAGMPEAEIQDLASQCVGLACAPGAGESWWDACAGSGGKSFHLADLMGGRGSVLATEPRAGSLEECRRRLARNRARRVTPRPWSGDPATAPDRRFDGVLVDAPCSGIGTWHRNPDARWRTPPDAVSRNAALQARLLGICADRVRPGGRLVYSVCTLTRAETEDAVRAFLAGRRDFQPDPIPHPLTGEPTPGLLWVWPWDGDCNGMFIARLRNKS